jgi:threonine aldolase
VSTLGRIHARAIKNLPDGTFNLEELQSKIRPDNVHYPVTRLVCLENTHNRCGGKVVSAEFTDEVGRICKVRSYAEYGLK